ncbi:MAG: MFS transporter [Cytophagales bacterium]|nr:MAG: MFS transporter [Cytophagales bacterium]
MVEKNNPKTIHAWCMYDWANSVYSLTITTAVFPEYFLAVTTNQETQNKVSIFGFELLNTVLYSYSLSLVFLLAALFSPVLSSIADYTGKKKTFMRFFCYLGSIACACLFFFTSKTIPVGVLCFILAGIGYSGSIVFYNSFLPEIVSEDQSDKVSAKGFAYGYVGSVLLLILNILMLLKPNYFGMFQNSDLPARISFLTVGLWWFLFAQYAFYYLPNNSLVKNNNSNENIFIIGFKQLKSLLKELSWQLFLKRFLFAFFFYNMGVQTVMYMATIFGKDQLHLETSSLIIVILIIQIIAILGAQVFARISEKIGNVYALAMLVFVWIMVCISAYFVSTANQFYLLAVLVGFVMGGVQSLSRSTYAKLIPQDSNQHATYFSFYDVMDKISTFAGTFIFGFIAQISGGMRNSTLALSVFFLISLFFLLRIPSKRIYEITKI